MNVNVIMIAHNQREIVKEELNIISLWASEIVSSIVVVDNASQDGLAEWLQEEDRYNYIIYDDGIEGYASILNTVIKEFEMEGDILILSPNYLVISDALQKMQLVLHEREDILAVSPSKILCGSKNGKNYGEAVDYVAQREKQPDLQKLELMAGAVLIKGKLIEELGYFDERLILPRSGLMDFLFRGVLQNYMLYECGNAYVYEIGNFMNMYTRNVDKDADRPILKEKWGMNYFNCRPNDNLIACIQEKPDAEIDVLEIGCDCGVNLLGIKNKYPNMRAYGVELNERAAEIASHIASVQIGDIEQKTLEFSDVKFDYILFGDVLEHLRDPEGAICYCRSLLKPEGRIIASIPNLMHYSVMRQLINGNFTYTDRGLLDRTHIHFFTYYEIIQMFKNAGYHIEQICDASTISVASEDDKVFVGKLMELSDNAEAFMFYAFQYIVSARIVN